MADMEKSVVIAPNGEQVLRAAVRLTAEEAELLRAYQAFGARDGLQGSMTCNDCGKQMEVYVQGDIGMFCECRVLLWKAS